MEIDLIEDCVNCMKCFSGQWIINVGHVRVRALSSFFANDSRYSRICSVPASSPLPLPPPPPVYIYPKYYKFSLAINVFKKFPKYQDELEKNYK